MVARRLPGAGDDLPNGAAVYAESARNLFDRRPGSMRLENFLAQRVTQTSLSFERTIHDMPAHITPHSLRRTGQESPFPAQRPGNQRLERHRLV